MAKTITELAPAGAVDSANDLIWLEQGGLPKKISPTDLGIGGGAAATTFIINADINTATPPTTELVTAEIVFRDLADDDDLCTVGFGGNNEFVITNNMRGGDFVFSGINAAGTTIEWLDWNPDSVMLIRSADNLAMYVDRTSQCLQATGGSITGLHYAGIQTAQTTTRALGGWTSYNEYNGQPGYERVLTESDIHRGLPIGLYSFQSGTGGGDPGVGKVGFDSATPASITLCKIGDESISSWNMEWLYGQIGVGDLLIFASEVDTADYITFTVDSVTDSTSFWSIGVTYVAGGTIFGSDQFIRMTWIPLSQAGGSGAGISGTPVNNQIAVWTGATDIEGSSSLLWDGTDVTVVGGMIIGATESEVLLIDAANIHFRDTGGTTEGIHLKNIGTTAANPILAFESTALNPDVHFRDGAQVRLLDGANTTWVAMEVSASGLTITKSGATVPWLWADMILDQPVLQDYGIASVSEVVSANAFTITYSEGPAFQVDLEAATAAVTGTISGGAVSGDYGQITVKVEQDSTTAQTLTWAGGTMRWAGGTAHPVTTTVGGFTLYTFETWDGGTIWYAAGADYS